MHKTIDYAEKEKKNEKKRETTLNACIVAQTDLHAIGLSAWFINVTPTCSYKIMNHTQTQCTKADSAPISLGTASIRSELDYIQPAPPARAVATGMHVASLLQLRVARGI